MSAGFPEKPVPSPAGGRILRNSLFGMVARVVDMLMRMAIVAVIARYLGTAGFGEFAFVMATTAFVLALTDFGLEPILVRDLNAVDADPGSIVGGILALRVLLGSVVLAGMAVVVGLSDWSPSIRLAMLVASLSQVLMAGHMVMMGVFRGHERMEFDAATSLLYQSLSFGLTVVAVTQDMGLIGIVLAQLTAEAAKLALLTGWVQQRFLRLRLVWNARQMAYNLKEALPIFCMALTSVVSFRLNVLFLKAWRGPEDIALFDSPQRLLFSISMIPLMIVVAIFPALCRLAGQDRPALRNAYATAFKYLFILGLGVSIVLGIWAEPIMRLLYGSSFAAGASSLRWLALSTTAGFLIPLTNSVMTSVGRQAPSMAGVLAGVIVNVLVNLVTVPSHGHAGAAMGYTAGTVVAIAVNGGLVRIMLGPASLATVAWRPLVAAALMAAVGAGLGRGGGLRSLIGLALAVATYAASLFLLHAVTVPELATLRAMRRIPPEGANEAAPSLPPL